MTTEKKRKCNNIKDILPESAFRFENMQLICILILIIRCIHFTVFD